LWIRADVLCARRARRGVCAPRADGGRLLEAARGSRSCLPVAYRVELLDSAIGSDTHRQIEGKAHQRLEQPLGAEGSALAGRKAPEEHVARQYPPAARPDRIGHQLFVPLRIALHLSMDQLTGAITRWVRREEQEVPEEITV